ncbi:MAG: hypothetical protein LAP38_03500 [Acidobacteriia bacterium]|nr:hypothetical protein [Terriglobia bacterium]
MKLSLVCSLLLASAYSASAQTAATLAAVGYTSPAPIPVVPGEVVTLFYRNVPPLPDGSLRTAAANTVPLPTVLAGLSVHVSQPPVNFPIFAVRQENDCTDAQGNPANPSNPANPACLLTTLRVQVPFRLQVVKEMVLDVDGQASRSFALSQITDNAHVLTSCDLTWDTNWFSSCSRVAFHGDGTQITGKSPARPGETIVVYLWGLGQTSPIVPSGEPSPPGVVLDQFPGVPGVRARFLDGPTILTDIPAFYSPEDAVDPGSPIDFVGLTPGQIGLYQINVAIPQSLIPTTSCGDLIFGTTDKIPANAVLHITTLYSGTEELGFCLKP